MARSRKKTPIAGVTNAPSEKADKQTAHRRERRKVRAKLGVEIAPEVLPDRREVSDVWTFAKDGKAYDPTRRRAKRLRK